MKDPIKDFVDTKKKMEKKYPGYTFETSSQESIKRKKVVLETICQDCTGIDKLGCFDGQPAYDVYDSPEEAQKAKERIEGGSSVFECRILDDDEIL